MTRPIHRYLHGVLGSYKQEARSLLDADAGSNGAPFYIRYLLAVLAHLCIAFSVASFFVKVQNLTRSILDRLTVNGPAPALRSAAIAILDDTSGHTRTAEEVISREAIQVRIAVGDQCHVAEGPILLQKSRNAT